MNWDGEVYEIPCPIIIPEELANQVIARKQQYKKYPSGNARHTHLAAGLVYCVACGIRSNLTTSYAGYLKDGTRKKWVFYQCSNRPNMIVNDCYGRIGAIKLDNMVWEKVWKFISEPGKFEDALQARIKQIQSEEYDAQEEYDKLELEYQDIMLEREKVITWARKKFITEQDLVIQLSTIDEQAADVHKKMGEVSLLLGDRAERLANIASLKRKQFVTGWQNINANLGDDAEKKALQQAYRRRLIQAIVERVDVFADKTIKVTAIIPLDDKPEDTDKSANIAQQSTCHSKTSNPPLARLPKKSPVCAHNESRSQARDKTGDLPPQPNYSHRSTGQ
jgi:hypothetical protein